MRLTRFWKAMAVALVVLAVAAVLGVAWRGRVAAARHARASRLLDRLLANRAVTWVEMIELEGEKSVGPGLIHATRRRDVPSSVRELLAGKHEWTAVSAYLANRTLRFTDIEAEFGPADRAFSGKRASYIVRELTPEQPGDRLAQHLSTGPVVACRWHQYEAVELAVDDDGTVTAVRVDATRWK